MAVNFQIKGLKQLQSSTRKWNKELEGRVDGEIKKTVAKINREQISLARVDLGTLRGGIFWESEGRLQYSMFSRAPYSAYVEFGTGALVDVPEGLEAYAMQFKGAGVKQVNLPARPFFFTPFIQEKDELIKRLEQLINDRRK